MYFDVFCNFVHHVLSKDWIEESMTPLRATLQQGSWCGSGAWPGPLPMLGPEERALGSVGNGTQFTKTFGIIYFDGKILQL